MKKIYSFAIPLMLIVVLASAGCATDGQSAVRLLPPRFESAESTDASLPPTSDQHSVSELLKEAETALAAANEAQEKGDDTAAMEQYSLMLELLLEADVDPAVFYNLRSEFARILASTGEQAESFDRHLLDRNGLPHEIPAVVGDLEIPDPLPEQVVREIHKIQHVYPEAFQRGLDRSYLYAPYVRRELRDRGLPEDLMWLAMIESLFNPTAVSRAGAKGMWQFIRATGRRYDLRIDTYVDERLDWQRETHAAIDYLTDLHSIFGGHWPLAVTAYNMGEYGLSRAINTNDREMDLWTLIETPPASYHIRQETKEYYAKLMATIVVAKDPERYGFKTNFQPPLDTVRVTVRGCYDLAALDEASKLPSGTLKALNPGLIQGITVPLGEYDVVVPADAHDNFMVALNEVEATSPSVQLATSKSFSTMGSHKVQRGETLGHIARKYGVSLTSLMRANNMNSHTARRLQAGQYVKIPGQYSSSSSSSYAATTSNGQKVYSVRRGDTLGAIARAHRVGTSDLQRWNNMGSSTVIRTGDRLYVSAPVQTASSTYSGEKVYHKVKSGEFPGAIAEQYGVSLADFLRWNNLTTRSTIHVGDSLVVYVPGNSNTKVATATDTNLSDSVTHTVRAGENPSTIAAKYGVTTSEFLAWNGLTSRSVIRVGEKYVVHPKGGSAAAAEPKQLVHVVARGQNPTTIARRYGVTVTDLLRWNSLDRSSTIRVGDKLVVFTN